jgi:predicted metalloprotease with PDZ domain
VEHGAHPRAALEPFDLENAVMSRELWFGEGFTNYYDQLARCAPA